MKFAKIVFRVAGTWGLSVLTPLYFMFDLIGRNDPPPITHPGFFYGFVGVALAWQIAFIFIATDPWSSSIRICSLAFSLSSPISRLPSQERDDFRLRLYPSTFDFQL